MRLTFALTFMLLAVVGGLAQTAPNSDRAGQQASDVTPKAAVSQVRPPNHVDMEVDSDTQGVDFGPYLESVLVAIRSNWYKVIPAEARPPQLKQGKVSIKFAILQSGHVAGMQLVTASGDMPLDRSAWGSVTASAPFAPLPAAFSGPYLALRMYFYYNLPKETPSSGQSNKK